MTEPGSSHGPIIYLSAKDDIVAPARDEAAQWV